MKQFLPPPVTPSERNRSPRAVCRLYEDKVASGVPPGGKGVRMGMRVGNSARRSRRQDAALYGRQNDRRHAGKRNQFLPPLMTPLVEEPIAMGGW